MVSYSRQQTPFVDSLYQDLVKAGYEDIWLDFQRLIPSAPWFDQIKAGVENAETMVLVVSADSMISKNVEDEWRMALGKKRIILVLFEAAPITNDDLKKCEWVDFRTDYKAGLKQLDAILTSAPQPENQRTPIPESGFKAPKIFWVTLILGVLVAFASLPVAWTLFYPFILFPLPKQIFQRNYIFSRVIPALLLLPLFFVYSVSTLKAEGNILNLLPEFFYTVGGIASFFGWVLAALLLTPAMQRRARPEAARIRFTNRNKAKPIELRSVKFLIDHAPEDGRYAEDLRRGLEKYGHEYVKDGEKPDAVFVMLSAYKKGSTYEAGKGLSLFPVVLQKTEVDRSLGKLQWLDFRRGMSSKILQKIAMLLPQPAELVKVLAVPPTGRLEIFPTVVNALQYFYIITGILSGGGLLTSVLSLARLMSLGQLQPDYFLKFFLGIFDGILLFGAVFYSLRGIRLRTGGTAALYPLLFLALVQGILNFFIFGVLSDDASAANAAPTLAMIAIDTSILSFAMFFVGLSIALVFLLAGWKDLHRWLPRAQTEMNWFEKAFLLYSPDGFGKFVLHILFHLTLLILLFFEAIFLTEGTKPYGGLVFFSLLAIFFRWLATRKSKKS
jgi:hypothetical protein